MSLTKEEIQAVDKRGMKLIREKHDRLREPLIQAEFSKEVVSNLLCGTRLVVISVDYVRNLVTFRLGDYSYKV
jgi:hypothetical protein